MKRCRFAWILLAALCGARPGIGAEAKPYGYTDTPKLPGTTWCVHDRRRPLPPVVTPGAAVRNDAPSDAVVLFDGRDLSQWTGVQGGTIHDGAFNIQQTGQISTRRSFGDCQLHVECATPAQPDGDAMRWGNSGIFLLGLYEVQVIQSDIYADGIAGAIYGQFPPLARALRPAGEWNSYDILFTAPRFTKDGTLAAPACLTVLLNGVLVQDHQAALGPTRHRALAKYDNPATRGPLMLQLHGSKVRYRNIWVRPLDGAEAAETSR